jgi:hypothetical protein
MSEKNDLEFYWERVYLDRLSSIEEQFVDVKIIVEEGGLLAVPLSVVDPESLEINDDGSFRDGEYVVEFGARRRKPVNGTPGEADEINGDELRIKVTVGPFESKQTPAMDLVEHFVIDAVREAQARNERRNRSGTFERN